MPVPTSNNLSKNLAHRYRADIEDLVVEDRLEEALNALQDLVANLAPQLRNGVLLLRRRHRKFSNDSRDQVADRTEEAAITKAILDLLEDALERPAIDSRYLLETSPPEGGKRVTSAPTLTVVSPSEEIGDQRLGVTVAGDLASGSLESPRTDVTIDEQLRTHWARFRRNRPSTATVAFSCEKITKRYGKNFRLDELSFRLEVGQITGVVGRNASGKTTLLRIVQGELAPDTGSTSYPMLTQDKESWSHIKSQLSYIEQFPGRWGGTVKNNLNYIAAVYGYRGQRNRDLVEWHVQRYGLANYQAAKWNELSGGFRMRYELVRALISKPGLLVLDEPLASLDVIARQEFLKNLRSIAYSTAGPVPIIVTSQHLYEIEAIADQMIVLDDGKCLFAGSFEDLRESAPSHLWEVNTNIPKLTFQERLQIDGLKVVETISDGFIVSCPKKIGAQRAAKSILERFGADITGVRDITGSCRRFFVNFREKEPNQP